MFPVDVIPLTTPPTPVKRGKKKSPNNVLFRYPPPPPSKRVKKGFLTVKRAKNGPQKGFLELQKG